MDLVWNALPHVQGLEEKIKWVLTLVRWFLNPLQQEQRPYAKQTTGYAKSIRCRIKKKGTTSEFRPLLDG